MKPIGAGGGAQKAAAPQARTQTSGANLDLASEKDGGGGDEINKNTKKTKDLDSGYAWLILLIMFLLQSSISGSSRVYGIVYAREVAIGYYDREQASWPIATASAVENLAGILTPALAQFLSWRQMELMSTSLFIMANLLAYYSQTLALDIVALGLVQGLALSTCTVLSLVINNDYFERYRTTAYGIQMSGSTFGVLYLGPLVTWILETHEGPENFRLVYLTLAGVFCLNLALVLFIRPRVRLPRDAAASTKMPHQQLNQRDPNHGGGGGKFGVPASRKVSRFESHFERKSSIASVSYRARSRRQSILSRAAAAPPGGGGELPQTAQLAKSQSGVELARAGALMKKISLCSMRQHDASHNPGGHGKRPSVVSSREPELVGAPLAVSRQGSLSKAPQLSRKLTTTSPFYLDQAADTASLASCNVAAMVELDLDLFKKLVLDQRINGELEAEQQMLQDKQQAEEQENEFSWQLVKGLLQVPYLHCTWIMLALYYLIARILVIILVDFAHDHGHSLSQSTDLLNYWSLGELIGRLFLGSLIDLKFLSCKSCIALTCITVGALLTLMVLVQSYLIYATCSLLIAALISLEYMLINVMMVEYLGKHRVTSCYSLAACLASAVLFARPSMIGLFRDQLGSYDGLLLLLAGLAFTFALLFYLLEPLLVRRWPKCAA